MAITAQQATAEVFLTAFRALSRREQEDILGRIARDRRFRRVLEDISDRLVLEEERQKAPRPLRSYIEDRERRERGRARRASSR
jgi:hypothetical protein